ncbi:MAG: MerR family transcriptional regulator [Saprospiraceae bacterium]|nr:MerR family transcriptional regulator [Lewinellaceae bacterium]
MAIYSIRDLEKLTGIKAHTIRIWEQRYKLVIPARTETNIRYYTDENLRLLFNVALLNRYGYKISKLAKMTPDEIAAKVAEISETNSSPNAQVDALTLAMIDLDESAFDRVFSAYSWEHGFEKTILELVYPFLDKLNVLWLTRSVSPAHEKFITNLIRRKLLVAIDKEPTPVPGEGARFILYLPEGESQELTLLFLHYLLRSRRQKVVYLGIGVSLDDLRDACQPFKPDYVVSILQNPLARQSIQQYVEQASKIAGKGEVLLSGAQMFINDVKLPKNARRLDGLPGTQRFLNDLVAQQKSAEN